MFAHVSVYPGSILYLFSNVCTKTDTTPPHHCVSTREQGGYKFEPHLRNGKRVSLSLFFLCAPRLSPLTSGKLSVLCWALLGVCLGQVLFRKQHPGLPWKRVSLCLLSLPGLVLPIAEPKPVCRGAEGPLCCCCSCCCCVCVCFKAFDNSNAFWVCIF